MAEVIVIGGANVDVKGRPAASVIAGTSNPGEVVTSVGGVGRNIAHNLALLGVDTALLAMVGDDGNGRLIVEETRKAGVDVSLLQSVPGHSGIYLALLDDKGELIAAINDMRCADRMTPGHLAVHHDRLAAASLIVADCNLPKSCLAWLFDFTRKTGIRLLIEPVSVPKARKLLGLEPSAFAITPNAAQLEALTGTADETEALDKLHAMGFRNVVVHRGRGGALASGGASQSVQIPAFSAGAIRDVTGAGDASVAGLVCGLVAGLDLVTAARMGQAAASLKLQSAESVAASLNRVNLFALAGIT